VIKNQGVTRNICKYNRALTQIINFEHNIFYSNKIKKYEKINKPKYYNFEFNLNSKLTNTIFTKVSSNSQITLVSDVSNMLPILNILQTHKEFNLILEEFIINKIGQFININKKLSTLITTRICVGSTTINSTDDGHVSLINNQIIFNSPGMYNSYWGIKNAYKIKELYPKLSKNYLYLEYRHYLESEKKVDFNGAKICKDNLNISDILILLSGDGNLKEEYGFRHLIDDAIKLNKEVIIIAINPNKYYKELAKNNKISLFIIS